MEWQHATADYKKVLSVGISGIIADIDESLKVHTAPEEIEYLKGLRKVCETFIAWAEKCSRRALELSKTVENPEYRKNLEKLSRALLEVPKNPPKTFYEACLTIYICFSADPDSLGTLDRYLSPFYFADLEAGRITREEAGECLQVLFLMIQAATSIESKNFTRGGESHFCVGGYLPDGSDAYNDLSKLILESLTDLPTYIPQVTLRWTKTQPREVLRFAMDLERRDPHKRIAFQNDEKRIKAYTEICGFSYDTARVMYFPPCGGRGLVGG
jgi:formate C-acetyltransferase